MVFVKPSDGELMLLVVTAELETELGALDVLDDALKIKLKPTIELPK